MSDFVTLQNRVMDATLRGGDGNRVQISNDINEAIHQVDLLLRPSVASQVVTLAAGQNDYSLATLGIVATSIRDIVYSGAANAQPWSLEQTSPSMIREMRQFYVNSNFVNLYALDGLDLLMLYPTTQASGDTATIIYVPRSADLSADTDVPTGLPEEWHEIYELAAIQRCMRPSSPEYAAQYMQMYEHKLNEYRKWRINRAGAGVRRAQVGRYGRRLRPRDNSTDWGS